MDSQTQKHLELIMFVAGVDSEKKAIQHAVREYNVIYDILQESKSELHSELVVERQNATLKLSESFEAVLEQHIESSEVIEELRKEVTEIVANRIFKSEIPVPEE